MAATIVASRQTMLDELACTSSRGKAWSIDVLAILTMTVGQAAARAIVQPRRHGSPGARTGGRVGSDTAPGTASALRQRLLGQVDPWGEVLFELRSRDLVLHV